MYSDGGDKKTNFSCEVLCIHCVYACKVPVLYILTELVVLCCVEQKTKSPACRSEKKVLKKSDK